MIITTSDIQLFQIIRQKLGDNEAEALVSFVDAKIKESNDQNLKALSTKEDIANVREEIGNLRTELKTDMANSKAEMIKWMFIFWVGTISVLSGIMALLLNAYIRH